MFTQFMHVYLVDCRGPKAEDVLHYHHSGRAAVFDYARLYLFFHKKFPQLLSSCLRAERSLASLFPPPSLGSINCLRGPVVHVGDRHFPCIWLRRRLISARVIPRKLAHLAA